MATKSKSRPSHLNEGNCPHWIVPDRHDPSCPACRLELAERAVVLAAKALMHSREIRAAICYTDVWTRLEKAVARLEKLEGNL